MPRFRLPFQRRSRYRKRSNVRMVLLLIFVFVSLGLALPLYLVYKPPDTLINYFAKKWPDILWHVPTESKVMALTIDDAPSEYTPELRRILAANNATATFFVIGSQIDGRQQMLQELVADGHELGNHAMHDEASKSLTNLELVNQIKQVDDMISGIYLAAGVSRHRERFFRPGSGFFTSRMRQTVISLGYRLALGNVYPHDPQIPYWRMNARHILSMVHPGSIIICHDRRQWTPTMLEYVLPRLKEQGYTVTTLSGLMEKAKD